jgi:hypothetical protein
LLLLLLVLRVGKSSVTYALWQLSLLVVKLLLPLSLGRHDLALFDLLGLRSIILLVVDDKNGIVLLLLSHLLVSKLSADGLLPPLVLGSDVDNLLVNIFIIFAVHAIVAVFIVILLHVLVIIVAKVLLIFISLVVVAGKSIAS